MLEELRRRNYAESTIHTYIHTVEHFSRHFHRSPDQQHPANPFCEAGTGVLSRSSDPPAELQSTNRGGLSRLFSSAVRVYPGTPEQADGAFGPSRSRCSSCTGVLGSSRESPEELRSQPERSISGDPVLLAFCCAQGPAVVGHYPTRTRHSDEASQQAF